MMVDDWFEA